MPRKLLNNIGQNVIEYTVVLVLVMLSIIIMGPYVIRSWNANMKGWEDSITDSFNDPLVDPGNVIKLPGCDCAWEPCDEDSPQQCCGLAATGCNWFEMSQKYVCTGLGCPKDLPPPPEGCNADPACCQTCDDNLPNPGGQSKEQCGSCSVEAINAQLRCPLNDPTCPITSICNPNTHTCEFGCPDGYREGWNLCGDPAAPKDYFCYRDTTCDFSCSGPVPDGFRYAGLCPNDDVGLSEADVDPVTHSLAYAMVPIGGCTDDRKCEVQCSIPFIPSSCGGGICRSCLCPWEDPLPGIYNPGASSCPVDHINQNCYCGMGEGCDEPPLPPENYTAVCVKQPEPVPVGKQCANNKFLYKFGSNDSLMCDYYYHKTYAVCVSSVDGRHPDAQCNCDGVILRSSKSTPSSGCTISSDTGSCSTDRSATYTGRGGTMFVSDGRCCECMPHAVRP